jgi:preprotein translocase subunit SecE
MNTNAQTQGSPLDLVRWGVATVLLVAAVGAFYVFSDQSLLLRVVGLLVVLGIAVAVVWDTARGQRTRGFLSDARTEVRKVVWPTRQETVQTTIAVVVMVLIVAVFLWILDWILLELMHWVTGRGN